MEISIEYRDSLSDQNQDKDKYSLVLANPPFKGSLDAESVSGDLLKVCKTKKNRIIIPYLVPSYLKDWWKMCLYCTGWSCFLDLLKRIRISEQRL